MDNIEDVKKNNDYPTGFDCTPLGFFERKMNMRKIKKIYRLVEKYKSIPGVTWN